MLDMASRSRQGSYTPRDAAVLAPAIFAAFMIVFALSIDDFVTSQFLATHLNTQTVPMLIYSSGRTAPNPALNATATLMLVISLAAIGLGVGGMRARQAPGSPSGGFRRGGLPDLEALSRGGNRGSSPCR